MKVCYIVSGSAADTISSKYDDNLLKKLCIKTSRNPKSFLKRLIKGPVICFMQEYQNTSIYRHKHICICICICMYVYILYLFWTGKLRSRYPDLCHYAKCCPKSYLKATTLQGAGSPV